MTEEELRREIEILRKRLDMQIKEGRPLKDCQKLSEELDKLIWKWQKKEK